MKSPQSPLARSILRDAYLTGKHIPLERGALFTYADEQYMVHVVPKANSHKKSFWQVICSMFSGKTNSKGPQ